MPPTFACPNCGAPLRYAGGTDPTMHCPFCNSSVIVPEELREKPARQGFQYQVRPARPSTSKGWLWLIVLIPVVILAFVFLPLLFKNTPANSNSRPSGPTGRKTGPVSGTGNVGGGFASVVLKFGSEGIGPGMFTDARSVAVDGEGHIYAGDYTGGRIQVFDPAGKFITQWSIGDRKTILRGLAADRKGMVYVAQGGNIYRYEGTTGKPLGQLQYKEGWGFDDVVVGADGGLVAAWYKNRDDIVRFDANGQTLRTIRAAISSASGDSELDTRIAVDGLGNIYALGTFNSAVFKFTPDGKFVNKFGSAGEQPGQFRAPLSIAVDGQGRIYVSDIKGVQVFDTDGRYLNIFKVEGTAFGMTFNGQNELFIAASTQIIKLAINQR